MLLHTFNLSALEAEASVFQSSRLAWSIERAPGQPAFGSEGNHQKQKAGENIFEEGSHVPAPASRLCILVSGIQERGYESSL